MLAQEGVWDSEKAAVCAVGVSGWESGGDQWWGVIAGEERRAGCGAGYGEVQQGQKTAQTSLGLGRPFGQKLKTKQNPNKTMT